MTAFVPLPLEPFVWAVLVGLLYWMAKPCVRDAKLHDWRSVGAGLNLSLVLLGGLLFVALVAEPMLALPLAIAMVGNALVLASYERDHPPESGVPA